MPQAGKRKNSYLRLAFVYKTQARKNFWYNHIQNPNSKRGFKRIARIFLIRAILHLMINPCPTGFCYWQSRTGNVEMYRASRVNKEIAAGLAIAPAIKL